jgi:hypothetical protein
MAVQTETRVIGGRNYRVTQLTALKARALFVRLVKMVGPMVAALLGSGNARGFLEMEGKELGPMIVNFCERISDEELDFFCSVLGEQSQIVNERGEGAIMTRNIIDVEFAGRLMDLFKWLAFALEVNFTDFLSAAKAIPVGKSKAPVSDPLPFREASIGTSGVL